MNKQLLPTRNQVKKMGSVIALGSLLSLGLWAHASALESGGALIAGPENAPITIEEFADFECPYCARGAATMKEVLKNYPDKVKLVFRNMPLPMHEKALLAAKAFDAIYLQCPHLAFAFQAEVFENQQQFKEEGETFFFKAAEKVGANLAKMKIDIDSEVVSRMIARDQEAAQTNDFSGTPSYVVGGEKVTGAYPYEHFKEIIDRQLHN